MSSTRVSVEMSWQGLVAGDEAVARVKWRNCRSRIRGYLATHGLFKHYRESRIPTLDGRDLSHFKIGYWDGLGLHKVMNIEGNDEVVDIK